MAVATKDAAIADPVAKVVRMVARKAVERVAVMDAATAVVAVVAANVVTVRAQARVSAPMWKAARKK